MNKIFWIFIIVCTSITGNAQESTRKVEIVKEETTFSVEITADTTPDELASIKKILKKEFNITASFEDVEVVNNKITKIKMKLIGKSQSFIKSLDSHRLGAIEPFKITLKNTGEDHYRIVTEEKN